MPTFPDHALAREFRFRQSPATPKRELAVLVLAAVFGVLSIVSVLMIPSAAIDDDEARGLNKDGEDNGKVGGITVLLECKPLLILAAALAFFISAMPRCFRCTGCRGLPSRRPAGFVAITIVVAQGTMILVPDRDALAEKEGTGWCC